MHRVYFYALAHIDRSLMLTDGRTDVSVYIDSPQSIRRVRGMGLKVSLHTVQKKTILIYGKTDICLDIVPLDLNLHSC